MAADAVAFVELPMFRPWSSPKDAEKIRFLTVVSTLTMGGTERAAVNCALGFKRAGMASAVLAYGGGGPRKEALDAVGVPVFLGGVSASARDGAIEQARRWSATILHIHRPGRADDLSGSILQALVHPQMRVFETNVFSYVDDSEARRFIDLHFHLSRWCLWKWSQQSRGLKGRSPGVVIPNSVDTSNFYPISNAERSDFRAEWKIPDTATVFGRIGQPIAGKWAPVMIESFLAVARKKKDAWLVLAGLPESLKPMLDALVPDVRRRVRILPLANTDAELRRYYGCMDVFVHASRKGESFGFVLCEAMLCGLPVITFATPLRDNSQIEVVGNHKTGIVVTTRTELTQAMIELADDGSLRKALGNSGPKWVRDRFDISAVVPAIIDLARLSLRTESAAILSEELARRSDLVQGTHASSHLEILRAAGIAPSFMNSILPRLVNLPLARRCITFARSVLR